MKVWSLAFGTFAVGVLVGAMLFRGEHPQVTSGQQSPALSAVTLPTDADVILSNEPAVAQANYVEPEAPPPNRLDDDAPPTTAKEDAVREVIDRHLKDLNAEEREIWYEELKGVPPGIVDDLLSVRRQFGATRPKPPLGVKLDERPPEGLPLPQPIEQPSGRAEWTVAIHAMRQARNIHLHNLANVHSPGYKRLVPVFSPIEPPAEPGHGSWGSQWQGVRVDLERSNVDPDEEWREVKRIDRWLKAVTR